MTVKNTVSRKVISVLLCLTLLMTYLPFYAMTAAAASAPLSGVNKVTDAATLNGWKSIFVDDSTETAGGVWTDKSVFSSAAAFLAATDENEAANSSYHLDMTDPNSFLISLSGIASNKQVTGYSTTPTDTVLVLDLSSSMRGWNYNSIDPLAAAANTAIQELLKLNQNNRVGVVLYSGADENQGTLQTRILMPLDRYTPDADGNYIRAKTVNGREGLGVVRGVKNSKGETEFGLAGNESCWSSGTFTQDGIYVATEMIMAASQHIEAGNIQAGAERMPIMVLMSDGEPSLVSTDYAQGTLHSDGLKHMTSDYEDGTIHTGTDTEFMVQLTAAYAKYRIEQKYEEHDLLFYSLGLKGNSNFATTILDPASHVITDPYWNTYLNDTDYKNWVITNANPNTNHTYRITTPDTIRAQLKAAVLSDAPQDLRPSGRNKYRYYIDKYFEADNDAALSGAFDEIVDEIILQSAYYPTLVDEGANINYGGYLSMVDTLGEYMEVKDMKHIQLGAQPFYGRNAARELSAISALQGLNEIQINLVEAVKNRLGVNDATALEVIRASQNANTLYFNSNTDFNNAISWYGSYSDAVSGAKYVAPWNGSHSATAPAGANCTIQSYYFYGAGEASQGEIRVGDMRYIEVDVVTFLDTNQTKVRVRIPASLIPLITYEVLLDGKTLDSPVQDLTVGGATAPIRLVYEVGLKDTLNSLNVSTLAADAYNAATGNYEFYTNKWDYADGTIEIGVTPPRTVGNSYAYFEPSAENEYMYYQYDTPIYQQSGNTYTLYTGDSAPSGDGFFGQRYYYTRPAAGSTSTPQITYQKIEALHLSEAKQVTEGGTTYWVVPKGTHVFADHEKMIFYKDGETVAPFSGGSTGTYKTSLTYYVAHTNHNGTPEYNMQAAMGNNGKLSIKALQGIRLQKLVPQNAGLSADETYSFTIAPVSGTLSGSFDQYLVNAVDNDGTGGATATTAVTASGNRLTVTLKGNQTLYIAGLPAGEYTVTEALSAAYVVSAINGIATTENSTTTTVSADAFAPVSFTNLARGTANFTISKIVDHPQSLSPEAVAVLNNKAFAITAKFMLNDQPLAKQTFYQVINGVPSAQSITTADDGTYTFSLKHNQQVTLTGVPVGTVITASETLLPEDVQNFTVTYYENGAAVNTDSATVTVSEHNTASIIVDNKYALAPAEVDIAVAVTKTVDGATFDWTDKAFHFALQRYDLATNQWIALGQPMEITTQNGSDIFKIGSYGITKADFTFTESGTYYYRVKEIAENVPGIIYDDKYHSFSVTVTDTDGDGAFEVAIAPTESATSTVYTPPSGNDTHSIDILFTNTYDPEHAVAEIIANKTVENLSATADVDLSDFEFGLYEVDAEGNLTNPNAVVTALSTHTGVAKLTLDPFGNVGTYRYVVKEIAKTGSEAKTGWLYNAPDVYVNVVVGSDDGGATLNAKVYVTNKAGTVAVPQDATSVLSTYFQNTYQPAPALLSIPVSKHLTGRELQNGEFRFILADAAGQTNPVALPQPLTVENGIDTAFRLSFSKVGMYFYDITEDATFDGDGDGTPGVANVAYDHTTFRVAVAVTDNDGVLSAEYLVANVQGETIAFENQYTPPAVTATIGGTKTLTGRPLKANEFTFVLTEAADAQGTVKPEAAAYTAKNTAVGTFTFPELTYTAAGTYYYVVTEQHAGETIHGVTYSDQAYVVTVTVTYDPQTGRFTAQTSHTAAQLAFTNTYRAAPTTVEIPGLKTLMGNRYLRAEEFTFELYATDSTYAYAGITPATVKNAADGKFVFKNLEALTFTAAGTYHFVVKETIPAQKLPGITYDTALYQVAVTVTDNQSGKLVAGTPVITRVIDGKAEPAGVIAFYNEYVGEAATLRLTGAKKLLGRPLEEGEFTFLLQAANEQFVVETNAPVLKTTNTADGSFIFGALTFTQEGTYYYVISEDATPALDWVTYDTTRYYVTVTVRDDTDSGKLVADYTISTSPAKATEATVAEFVNVYAYQEIPQTGVNANLPLWLALLVIGFGGMVGTTTRKKKTK